MSFSSTSEYDAVEQLINMFDESIDTNYSAFEAQIDIVVDMLIDWTSIDSYDETAGTEANRADRMLTAWLYIWTKHVSAVGGGSTQVGAVRIQNDGVDGYWNMFKTIASRYDITVNHSSLWMAVAGAAYDEDDYRISQDLPESMQ